jgi:hypothetical protein
MNFERGIDPKESMGIGEIAIAPRLIDVEFVNRMRGKGNWWVQRLEGAQIIQLLEFLSTSSLRVKNYYSNISDLVFLMEARGNIMPICNIFELRGRTIIFDTKVYRIKKDLDLS